MTSLRNTVAALVARYPPAIAAGQATQVDRFAFEVGLALQHTPRGGTICDIGGGWGSFALGCAANGLRSTLIDDFRDGGFFDEPTMSAMRRLYAEHELTVISRDVVAQSLDFPEHSLDTITIFDSLEHWHNSPKKLLAKIVRTLRPGGTFILGSPNCVNLRKRITVPLGRGKWSGMADWYEADVFRGHVREPDLDDILYMARDMKLERIEIIGRNWSGYATTSRVMGMVMPLADRLLRLRPSLCSDIYLIGKTPAG